LKWLPRAAALGLLLLAAGCITAPVYEPPTPAPVPTPSPSSTPAARVPTDAELLALPEPVPVHEPRSRYGNPPFYEVFGRRYEVLPTSAGYFERGIASWYGPTFHGERASTQEPYDMYALTAAHKTLPLPCYARVTNLKNGRSTVVRINDRGPFKDDRIIDLSYAAALRLDMLREGTTLVEVRTLAPADAGAAGVAVVAPAAAPAVPPSAPAQIYAQAGAFGALANAERLRDRLQSGGFAGATVLPGVTAGREVYRVRIGPLATIADFDVLIARLRAAGYPDARLATD
jgi:rare lipoprotein A